MPREERDGPGAGPKPGATSPVGQVAARPTRRPGPMGRSVATRKSVATCPVPRRGPGFGSRVEGTHRRGATSPSSDRGNHPRQAAVTCQAEGRRLTATIANAAEKVEAIATVAVSCRAMTVATAQMMTCRGLATTASGTSRRRLPRSWRRINRDVTGRSAQRADQYYRMIGPNGDHGPDRIDAKDPQHQGEQRSDARRSPDAGVRLTQAVRPGCLPVRFLLRIRTFHLRAGRAPGHPGAAGSMPAWSTSPGCSAG